MCRDSPDNLLLLHSLNHYKYHTKRRKQHKHQSESAVSNNNMSADLFN
jgi:hypothetical protein